jgi:ABC-type lipoprotein export system ATPase subunit
VTPVVEARGVARRFGEARVVDGVSLEVAPGEHVALVGPSGSGKTTLLQLVGLLDRPTSGQIIVGGEDAWARAPAWRARTRLARLGFVFQDGNLFGHLTARENVAIPAWNLRRSRAAAFSAADELLARFGLEGRGASPARTLSTGERQRVAIARALINRPALVVADEPTGSLDSAAAERVHAALAEIAAGGTALLVVTHDRDAARRAARVLSLRDGRLEA